MAGEDKGNNNEDSLKALVEGMSSLGEVMKGMQAGLGELTSRVKTIEGGVSAPVDQQQTAREVSNADLERMDRADFMKVIMDKFNNIVDTKFSEISNNFQSHAKSVNDEKVSKEIKAAQAAHKDFDDWIPEITKQAEKNPNLTVEDLYVITRNANPEKATELDAKYAPEAPDESNEKKEPGPIRSLDDIFGGFEPEQSGGKEDTTSLDSSSAAAAAVDEVFSKLDSNIGET